MTAFTRLTRPLLLAAACSACVMSLQAEDKPDASQSINDQDAVTISGLFNHELPRILHREDLRFTITPLWGDAVHSDVIRVRCTARYAFTKDFEGSADILPYCDNFSGNGPGGVGIAEYRFGAKYAWNDLLQPYVNTAFGGTVTLPAPGAPEIVSLGVTSFTPYVVFSHDWPILPGLSNFLNFSYQIYDHNPAPGRIAPWQPDRDNFAITPGVVLHRAPWHYTFAVTYTTTAPAGDNHQFLSLQPSVSWEIPEHYTRWTRGRWVAGAGYEANFYSGGFENRVTGRLKWDFDWKKTIYAVGRQVYGHLPWTGNGATPSPPHQLP